jgi:hypothetical protein
VLPWRPGSVAARTARRPEGTQTSGATRVRGGDRAREHERGVGNLPLCLWCSLAWWESVPDRRRSRRGVDEGGAGAKNWGVGARAARIRPAIELQRGRQWRLRCSQIHCHLLRCLIPPMSGMKYRRSNLVLLMCTTSYYRLVLRSIKG